MKILKFGGTSLGSINSILRVRNIIEDTASSHQVVIVASALDGITDLLLSTAHKASNGDKSYEKDFDKIISRHLELADGAITYEERLKSLNDEITELARQLKGILYGVYLIRDLSRKTINAVESYGELLSTSIVAAMLDNPEVFDARDFIKTENRGGKDVICSELTSVLICSALKQIKRLAVVPGFVSSDKDTGETTNLGRGGSDHTAALIAAALDAETLDIWTDVDGFMTADPKMTKSAYTINELSYNEAMELCNFGVKVIYPPSIYPVCIKNIPIHVRNTFNPTGTGTTIKDHCKDDHKEIKGISSISGTTLITVAGLSMVDVIGVNRRIFTALADNGISVFLVSQASSENSTSIGVKEADAEKAVKVLDNEFANEIETGAMFHMRLEKGLATIAIVGNNMKHVPGVAGKLFGTLGRSGISVIAFAQGASETNISFVIKESLLKKALNAIHDSFFLSEYNVLNLFICGVGTVGGKLIEQIRAQYESLKSERRLKLKVVGIASSRKAIFDKDGINLDTYRTQLEQSEDGNTERLRRKVVGMNMFNSVFVDCTASKDVADIYLSLLENNVSVVAANKIAASSDYDNYARLKKEALARGVKFRFETNVGAGLPIIGTINDLINSGDKILKIEAVLSGTLNFILNEVSPEVPFSEAVRRAKAQGYSEPDPRIDLSGGDVIRKIVILSREAGYKTEVEDVEKHLFVPASIFKGSLDDFWRELPKMDHDFEDRRRNAEQRGMKLRFVAQMHNGHASVLLKEVGKGHPFYNLEDSNNIVMLTTERYKEYPMLIQGYGAGASVTAAGVLANIMSIANI